MTLLALPEAASEEAKRFAVVFDFDTDSCYPAPAVSLDGTMNAGLEASGGVTGQCRQLDQFKNANTYSRTVSIRKGGSTYSVHMYALYFQKDMWAAGSGHRHDWEYVLVWLKDGALTHASFSAHGGVTTKAKEELSFDTDKPNNVKAVYHNDAGLTHSLRPAKSDEAPENELHAWVTPRLVEWDQMYGSTASNTQLRQQFNSYDYGHANCAFNDKNFPNEIAKNPPELYPGPDEWKQVAGNIGPVLPQGLVARWYVLPTRDADRDNRFVPLLPGQRAMIAIYPPGNVRTDFLFTLKHDKHNADDRARTPRIGHGDMVSGDAQDWPGFGKRIYLGDRHPSLIATAGNDIYVDLVLVQ